MNQHATDGIDDEHLSRVPIFAGLRDKELQAVRRLMTRIDIEPGFVLARQGAYGNEFFIVLSGNAQVDRDGEVVAEVGPGDFQGELSLLDGGPRLATVTATTPMTILVANHAEFNSLLETTPMVARQMLPAIVARLRHLAGDAHDL
jgi:CRP-like cAMP-binding protein